MGAPGGASVVVTLLDAGAILAALIAFGLALHPSGRIGRVANVLCDLLMAAAMIDTSSFGGRWVPPLAWVGGLVVLAFANSIGASVTRRRVEALPASLGLVGMAALIAIGSGGASIAEAGGTGHAHLSQSMNGGILVFTALATVALAVAIGAWRHPARESRRAPMAHAAASALAVSLMGVACLS